MPPRYVVLRHESPGGLHWDFMLEMDGVLATWALAEPPAAAVLAARPLPDHRVAYLEYEGPISGGRGSVTRWDRGTYHCKRREADEIVAVVDGEILQGEIILRRLSEAPAQWTLTYVPLAGQEAGPFGLRDGP